MSEGNPCCVRKDPLLGRGAPQQLGILTEVVEIPKDGITSVGKAPVGGRTLV